MSSWKRLPNTRDTYAVSTCGRVVRQWADGKWYELSYDIDRAGYMRVSIDNTRQAVHHIVADAFIPNPYNYTVVHHKDKNPSNNAKDNLERCTQQYNVECSLAKHYLLTAPDGTEHKVFNLRKFCRENDLNSGHMTQVVKGKTRAHKGWLGRYIE